MFFQKKKKVIVQDEMPVIIGIRLIVLFIRKEVASFGIAVHSSIPQRVEANRRSELILGIR